MFLEYVEVLYLPFRKTNGCDLTYGIFTMQIFHTESIVFRNYARPRSLRVTATALQTLQADQEKSSDFDTSDLNRGVGGTSVEFSLDLGWLPFHFKYSLNAVSFLSRYCRYLARSAVVAKSEILITDFPPKPYIGSNSSMLGAPK